MAFVDVTGASTFIVLDFNPDAELTICIRPLAVPVTKVGMIDCDGGSDLGITALQDHRVGEVGLDGFSADECLTAGGTVESSAEPHPNVCNGPLQMSGSDESDSGAGALKLAYDAAHGLQGLPVEITVEAALPCGDEGEGTETVLGLTTAPARATIIDVDNRAGESFAREQRGEAFSCHRWNEEDGPGQFVAALPALHGFVGADMITVFVFDD